MKQLLVAIVLYVSAFVTGSVGATAQAPDIIVIDGEEHALYSNPLDIWLKDNPEIDMNEVDKQDDDVICISSGNWRGYVATFAIEQQRLRLRSVERSACGDTRIRNVVTALFGGEKTVDAEWFSGILVIPSGQRVAYVHLGYGSLFSEYRLFRIEAGRVIAETKMDVEQYNLYRERQFEAYKQTAAYVQAFAELSKEDSEGTPDLESFLYNVDTDYTSDMMLPFPHATSARR